MLNRIIIFDIRPLLHGKVSGVEIFTKNIALSLKRNLPKKCKIIFWTNAKIKFDFGEFKKMGICVQTFWPNKIFNIIASIFRFPKIDQLILKQLQKNNKNKALIKDFKQNKIVLVVPDPRPAPVSEKVIKIFTIHDLSPLHFAKNFNWKTRFFHQLIRWKKEILESDKIIVPSFFTKKDLLQVFGQTQSNLEKKIKVIYEGIE